LFVVHIDLPINREAVGKQFDYTAILPKCSRKPTRKNRDTGPADLDTHGITDEYETNSSYRLL